MSPYTEKAVLLRQRTEVSNHHPIGFRFVARDTIRANPVKVVIIQDLDTLKAQVRLWHPRSLPPRQTLVPTQTDARTPGVGSEEVPLVSLSGSDTPEVFPGREHHAPFNVRDITRRYVEVGGARLAPADLSAGRMRFVARQVVLEETHKFLWNRSTLQVVWYDSVIVAFGTVVTASSKTPKTTRRLAIGRSFRLHEIFSQLLGDGDLPLPGVMGAYCVKIAGEASPFLSTIH